MYTLTFIYFEGGTPHIGSVTSPSRQVLWTLYFVMLTSGWRVRLWDKSKKLAA